MYEDWVNIDYFLPDEIGCFSFLGRLTYIFSIIVDPIFGSLAVLPGIADLIINGRGTFLLNCLVLWLLNIAALISTIVSVMDDGCPAVITVLGICLGLIEVNWGMQELWKIKYQ